MFFSRVYHRFNQNVQVDDAVADAKWAVSGPEIDTATELEKRRQRIEKVSEATENIIKENTYSKMIKKFTDTFDAALRDFI